MLFVSFYLSVNNHWDFRLEDGVGVIFTHVVMTLWRRLNSRLSAHKVNNYLEAARYLTRALF